MCGEKCYSFFSGAVHRGSPPRVRGKVTELSIITMGVGITPACAGKSCKTSKMFHLKQDHPRVCGEKILFAPRMRFCVGSPPRVRGKGLQA